MRRILLAGLLKIELPGHTVLLTDGGTVTWDGDSYASRDALFGMVAEPDELENGVGEEAPSGTVRFVPPPEVASADLIDPAYQDCRMRGWLAEIDADTGEVVGTPSLELDAIIDVPRLSFTNDERELEVDHVSIWQRLFDTNEGNVMNGLTHRQLYPSETGMDNTTGVSKDVPWGTNSVRTG